MDDLLGGLASEFERGRDTYERPGDLASALYPPTVSTSALELIDEELLKVYRGETKRLMIFCPPQEGKSERVSHYFALWWLMRRPDTRIAIASYDKSTAVRWGRDIRNDVLTYDGADGNLDLGLRLQSGSRASDRWKLADPARGGIFCVGTNGALTGRAVDLLIIDDPIKGWADADSEALRQKNWEFWTGSARTRLGRSDESGVAPVVIIQTRWHEDDLSGRLLEQSRLDRTVLPWKVVSIPAQAEEDDILGREPGEWLESARGRTVEEWEEVKAALPNRDWIALYQQRPSAAEGNIFKRDWWQTYDLPRAMRRPDGTWHALGRGRTVISWDMAFKDTADSSYVVGQVWHFAGADASLLDQVRERMEFTETLAAVEQLAAKWPQAAMKIVEDKANGPAVISALRRKVPGLVPYTPQDSKEARARAVAPYIEAGNVWLPAPRLAPWIGDFIHETGTFPNGANDDQVDAMSQALAKIMLEGGGRAYSYMEGLLRERGIAVLNDRREGHGEASESA